MRTLRIPKAATAAIQNCEVQPLIDRFAKAQWIKGLNIDHPDFYLIDLSELGRKGMLELAELFRPFAACVQDGAKRPPILAWLKILVRLRSVVGCLQAPRLSEAELWKLIAIAVDYDRDRSKTHDLDG
jgi:hypothetical protein